MGNKTTLINFLKTKPKSITINDMTETSIKDRVLKALERVRPYLQSDGGDIEFIDVSDDMTVKVKLTGACNGCPYSMQTLKAGVEQAIMKEVPEIRRVISA
jgi:Fe-S cluster biogenesis protein NfuA